MAGLGAFIKGLRDSRGLTQGQVAEFAHVTRGWLSRVEIDDIDRPDPDLLRKLANYYQVPAETLLAIAGYDVAPQAVRAKRSLKEIAAELDAAILRQEVEDGDGPILVDALAQPMSAGAGAPETEIPPIPFWPAAGERNHVYKAVEVVGDCLEPRVMRGHWVVVDLTARDDAKPGDFVAAQHDGEYLVKILEARDGLLYLVALQGQEPIQIDDRFTRLIGVVKGAYYKP